MAGWRRRAGGGRGGRQVGRLMRNSPSRRRIIINYTVRSPPAEIWFHDVRDCRRAGLLFISRSIGWQGRIPCLSFHHQRIQGWADNAPALSRVDHLAVAWAWNLTHFAQNSKMGDVTEDLGARLANRPFLVSWLSGTLAVNPERQSAWKSKTKNNRLTSLVSNPWIGVSMLGTLS